MVCEGVENVTGANAAAVAFGGEHLTEEVVVWVVVQRVAKVAVAEPHVEIVESQRAHPRQRCEIG